VEIIKARYAVGCDGARSKVRQSIGKKLLGDSANQAWGVMDALLVTDFPDIRLKTLIQSANQGSIVIIPREGGYLVRIYVEMDKLKADERVSARNMTCEDIVAAANRVFHPYRIEVKEVPWWSVYEIGQRLTGKFDNGSDDAVETRHPCVFIAGDACHTHSPKAGQGMNVSMGDTFNLGWKLASVLRGRSSTDLLHTYSLERQAVAQTLIDFDREWSRMIGAPPKIGSGGGNDSSHHEGNGGGEGVDPETFQRYFVQSGRYTAGTAHQYRPSLITGTAEHQHLATGFEIGTRFHSAPVVRLADAKPMHLGHLIEADGRWRIFAFGDEQDPAGPCRLRDFCTFMETAPESPLNQYIAAGQDRDSIFDIRAIVQQAHRSLTPEQMPGLLLPRKGKLRLKDYEKVFCPDLKSDADIFQMRGIDRGHGCMVIVRPDQHLANILPLTGFDALNAFFAAFMLAPDQE
ncbi:MAG: FAD-dependent monooxygenase, partial [Rhizobiaceae bacterium]